MTRRPAPARVAGLGLVLALAACSSPTGTDAETGFAQGDGSYTRIAPEQRTAAPVLKGEDLAGRKLTTADAAGKVIVVNVWGSWCAPCRHEAPQIVEAATKTKGKAVFYGVNTRDLDTKRAEAFVRTFKISYANFYDPDGAMLLDWGQVPAKAIPTTLVIDAQGRVAARIMGETTASTLVGTIDDIAAGK